MNKATVNYDTMILLLTFEGVEHSFDLKQGDAGDYWHGFQHHGLEKDLNFWTDEYKDETFIGVNIYATTEHDDGIFSTDTSDEVSIALENITEIGDRAKYETYWWYEELKQNIENNLVD